MRSKTIIISYKVSEAAAKPAIDGVNKSTYPIGFHLLQVFCLDVLDLVLTFFDQFLYLPWTWGDRESRTRSRSVLAGVTPVEPAIANVVRPRDCS